MNLDREPKRGGTERFLRFLRSHKQLIIRRLQGVVESRPDR